MRLCTRLALLLAVACAPGAALAGSYTGTWPVSVTKLKGGGIHFGNFQVCLMLQDDGSQGWPHSGEAYITQQGTRYQGVFVVIGSLLSVTIGQGSSNGELASFELNAAAAKGAIGAGLFEEVEGEALPTGVAAFGAKDGC